MPPLSNPNPAVATENAQTARRLHLSGLQVKWAWVKKCQMACPEKWNQGLTPVFLWLILTNTQMKETESAKGRL